MSNLTKDVSDLVDQWIKDEGGVDGVNSLHLDLDSYGRAGLNLIVGPNFIACRSGELSGLRYYGGFEYHCEDCIETFGDLTIFHETGGEECYVSNALAYWWSHGEEAHKKEQEDEARKKEQEDEEIIRLVNLVRYIGEDDDGKSCYRLDYKGQEWRGHCNLELAEEALNYDKQSK